MARERDKRTRTPKEPLHEPPAEGDPLEGEIPEDGRRAGPLEAIFQEAVRRAAGVGLSSFFMTEEAVRRAFAEVAPKDWTSFVSQQGEELREQMIARVSKEFGEWLQSANLDELVRGLLDGYEFNVNVSISAKPKDSEQGSSLQIVPRRK
ncbi:MAG: hypothetical protein GY725_05135 [bacterium]|nr:hypothetical protein [bacterium]